MVCVHAHPDDEALFTAGVQAHYGRQGVRQVLITCTTGGLGFDAEGRSSIDHAHDAEIVACT
jgi:LmbE family N-acetylglucosaminyl deacetylase